MEWNTLINLIPAISDEIRAEAHIQFDSPWFSGHFPGEPILPGIAQLAMVMDAIRQKIGKNFKISGLKKIRFKQIIRPDDHLIIAIAPDKGKHLTYSFTISLREEVACSGIYQLSAGNGE